MAGIWTRMLIISAFSVTPLLAGQNQSQMLVSYLTTPVIQTTFQKQEQDEDNNLALNTPNGKNAHRINRVLSEADSTRKRVQGWMSDNMEKLLPENTYFKGPSNLGAPDIKIIYRY